MRDEGEEATMWFTSKRTQQRRLLANGFPPAWRTVLERRWALWHTLSPDEREQLETLTINFVVGRRWEAARGFTITDEVQVLIAAQACLLLLGFDPDIASGVFTRVPSIIVHADTLMIDGERRVGPNGTLAADGPQALDGQAHQGGPVIVVWPAVVAEARHTAWGRNVVLHEFAHQLDMVDGVIDGTPPIPDAAARARFVAAATEVYEAVRRGESSVLRPYAGTDPGEFFAVATEVFFTQPLAMQAVHPTLYDELVAFYRQDPANRMAHLGIVG